MEDKGNKKMVAYWQWRNKKNPHLAGFFYSCWKSYLTIIFLIIFESPLLMLRK